MLTPNNNRFLCDKCDRDFLFQEMAVISGNKKYCKGCYDNRGELTDTQRSILIWLYDAQVPDLFDGQHLTWQHVDQGNLINAYQEIIGEETFLALNNFLMDIQALIIAKYVRTHTMDAFYAITSEGITFLEENKEPIIIYQCPECGDLWSDEYDDSMILESIIAESDNDTTIESECSQCEDTASSAL